MPPLVVEARRSTDVLAIDDEDVRQAVAIIRREATRGVTAGAVADRVPVSRRSLEVRFREAVGRSLQQEVLRVRVEHAKVLLRRGELKLPDVAARSGFGGSRQLIATFGKIVGMTPSEYRRLASSAW